MNEKETEMTHKILIAEDDTDIVELLRLYLENAGYQVVSAGDGRTAYSMVQSEKPDLAIVDVMMPEMNGFDLVRSLRLSSDIPIIILSAMDSDSDKIMGLDIGADDYISKPFNPLEVIARIKANLRRSKNDPDGGLQEESAILRFDDLELDRTMFKLTRGEREIQLTLTEFRILAMLMENPGRIFTRAQIYERINGDGSRCSEHDDHVIMVHISNLRDKMEDDPRRPEYLKTIRGLGYKLENRR